MKFLRRILIMIMLVCLPTVTAFAAGNTVTVRHTPDENPAADVAFQLYRLEGDMPNVQTAYSYVLENELKPAAQAKTDENGSAVLSGLENGTYLMMGQSHYMGERVCALQMSLVTLPGENGLSEICIEPKYEWHEPNEKETYKVLLIFGDGSKAYPDSVKVDIWRNGSVFKTVTLTKENSWQCLWEGVEPTDLWNVSAELPEGYTVTYDREGNTFIVRCEKKAASSTDPAVPNLPQTGQLWWPVPVLLITGLLCILFGLVRRKGSKHES